MRFAIVIGFAALTICNLGWTSDSAPEKPRYVPILATQIWKTRPFRRDTPLRDENISDREVVELEGIMKELYPGSIVYISAVTTGCPCQDGPNCTDQVWSVASRDGISKGIALARIEGKWQLGPLQEWWLIRDRIWAMFRKSRKEPDSDRRIYYQDYLKQMKEHNEAFPRCEV